MVYPKITIITPVKNSAKTLEKSIKSLLQQNYPNLEYIIMDGGSTDGTLDVIKKYEKNITYWQSKNDGSNVVAHIEGIKKASGEIVSFLNADDFYEPEILRKAGADFAEDSSLDIVSFRFRTIKNDKVNEEVALRDIDLNKNKVTAALGINARFFKKDLFYKYGFPLTNDDRGRVLISNDLEYITRFLLKGVKNKSVDYIGYNYVIHDDSLTFSKSHATKIRLCEDKIFIAKKFLNSSEFNLAKTWRKTFKKWIKKYRAMLVASHLKQGHLKEAKENFLAGSKENGFIKFAFYSVKTLIRSIKEKGVGF